MMGQMAGSGTQQSGARERDPLERLLGLVEPPADSTDGESTRLQVAGRRDDLPTWLVSEEWRLYARPFRGPRFCRTERSFSSLCLMRERL